MTEPLEMLKKKEGTLARPAWQVMANDKGFGRKVYDPNAETTPDKLKAMGNIITHIATAQVPEGQLTAGANLVKGEGDKKLNLLQLLGPVAGVTFSKGAPGGPAVGELYRAREQHQQKVNEAMPEIRKMIKDGNTEGAVTKMNELGMPRGLQNFHIRTTLNPELRLTPRAMKDFQRYATPEQKQRMERLQQQRLERTGGD
jgi:hypothetical protein